VHALEKTVQLLESGGFVIEAHDILEPRRIEVHSAGRITPAGELLDSAGFSELRQTNAAIDDVIDRGLFEIEEGVFFEYRFHAPSLAAFDEWLGEQWDTTYYPEHYAQIVRDEMHNSKDNGEIVIRANARMIRMRLCT